MKDGWKRTGERVIEEKTVAGVPFLYFPALEETKLVRHGFSTRMGGVSTGVYESMNFAFLKGDNRSCVMENYRRMAKALCVETERMVLSWQTHTTNIRKVTEDDRGKGIFRERDYRDIDGLITDVPDLVLVTFYADCVPLYFLDPVNGAIGLSHSGWRGTAAHMGKKTVEAMSLEFGSKPKDIIACIGPSICRECYEVGEEVALAFSHSFDEKYRDEILKGGAPGKYQLDLWRANEIVLWEAGIEPGHVSVTDICTHCNPDSLFSHRTMGSERGNLAAFLCLNGSHAPLRKYP